MRPRIGITAELNEETRRWSVGVAYAEAVAAAGGMPLALAPLSTSPSYVEDALSSVDGLVLSGGGDIDPGIYGAGARHKALRDVNQVRDLFEMQIARRAYLLGTPTLGICRGMQVINVALGGTLFQDLTLIAGVTDEEARLHRQSAPFARARHEVEIAPGTVLHDLYREADAPDADGPLPLMVNSMHHQSVDDAAPTLAVSARRGAVIEAIESRTPGFYLGVQWHPEYLGNASPLFRGLVDASRNRE